MSTAAHSGPPAGGDDGPPLLSMRVDAEPDVFAARQLAREAAAATGLDRQDQVRVATALSEVGRDALAAGGARVDFALRADGALRVTVFIDGRLPAGGTGLAAAGRLVDVTVAAPTAEPGSRGDVITLAKAPPAGAAAAVTPAELRRRLAATAPISLGDELRVQNAELVAALEELQHRQDELLRLNAELEDTNRGVLALYNQLSSELDETNRGVVALYAELDERGSALARVNDAKTRFLRSVSHELRTPVTSILGLARLLLDPTADPLTEEQRRQVEFIASGGGDLLALVNDLLDLARVEAGKIETSIDEVDVRTLFAYLEGTMRPLATRADVSLVFDEPADVGSLRTDETLLGRVLRNLLSNALKFTERGQVRVSAAATRQTSTSPAEDMVSFTVHDTGIGLSPAEADRVFEEFYQARSHLHGLVRGTGLGLPYARRVCELLGGRLELLSAPGVGSTFTATVPRDSTVALNGLLPRDATATAGTTSSAALIGTALVVDDDPAFRTAMRSLLAGRAERVIEAADGPSALARLHADVPDVMFLDLMLPGLDGASVLAEISDDPVLRHVPVVVVTWADLEVAGERTTLGSAAALLSKSALSESAIDGVLGRIGLGR